MLKVEASKTATLVAFSGERVKTITVPPNLFISGILSR